ncbi:MAG: hypothetical protein WC773_00320 [Patescibacteria group bacterium]
MRDKIEYRDKSDGHPECPYTYRETASALTHPIWDIHNGTPKSAKLSAKVSADCFQPNVHLREPPVEGNLRHGATMTIFYTIFRTLSSGLPLYPPHPAYGHPLL